MMITSGTNTFLFSDGAVLVVSSVPGLCTCSRAAFFFIGRNGRTRCLDCVNGDCVNKDSESKHYMVAPSECDVTDDGPDAQTAFQKAIV